MRNKVKITLALLMATAMSIPAYAAGNSGGGGASAGSTSSGGTSGSNTGAPSATGSTGTSATISGTNSAAHSTIGSTGTGTVSSGAAGTRVGVDAATGSRAGASGSVGVNTNGAASFNKNDADRSGTLSLDEYRAYTGTTGANARIQDDFRALDTNGDNYLSQGELSARASGAIR
jgi:hypothetical protein